MSIVSVDNIQPIGSGTSVTVNKSVTLESGNTNITGVCTATSFVGAVTGNVTGNLTGTASTSTNAATAYAIDSSASLNTSGIITATSINDSIGELRNFPQVSVSSNRVLTSSDAGKHIINTGSGGWTINTSSGFSVGDVIRIINASDSSQILYQAGGVTTYSRRDGGVSGDHSIVDRGSAIIICTGSNQYYVSGDI